ncbi:MAG TPA: Rid family hydrolase, partial [Candidatus Aminicenantes bacterium]|nr:Rid family hydrolase [Candidatus Aminicenantes bacterium]
ILAAAGTGFERVVKTTVYLIDIADFRQVNEIYGTFFPAPPPARSAIAVRELPLGAEIEIEVIAQIG